jgi:hypothetical protein
MWKQLAVLALCAGASLPAAAQYYRGDQECWNPGAGHFERVRPGERQDDLDFRRCRPVGEERNERPRECWNPRSNHYEAVRPGDRQDDLDFRRCRWLEKGESWSGSGGGYGGSGGNYSGGSDRWRSLPRECWNPQAGHFEAVRPGERQDDLDFGRCRLQYEMECWNPRARHFEAVRGGERQDDLDFTRCRRR